MVFVKIYFLVLKYLLIFTIKTYDVVTNTINKKSTIMNITIIAAVSSNGVIGINNTLPWSLPKDLKRFKSLTTGHTIVMGRKTFESIGKPLPNRRNIVITRDTNWCHEGVEVLNNILEITQLTEDVFIIGGSEIYKQSMGIADKLEITLIDKDFEGDTYFPEIEHLMWKEENRESFNNGEFDYHFITYKKNIL
jgi:dihydrofolate reductase